MKALAALAVLALAVLALVFVNDHEAWTPDEPRVVALGQSVAHGSWVVPYLGEEPFLEQPPLHAWSVGLAFRAFGETTAVARGVSVLWSVLTLLVTFLLGEKLAGRRTGLLAAILLGVTALFFTAQHRVTADPPLAFFVAGSTLASLHALTAETGRAKWLGPLLAYAGASLAYLSKGVVGVGLAGFGFLAVVIALRDAKLLLRAHLWLAPLVFAAIAGPWHLQLHEECGLEGLRTVVWENSVGRAGGSSHPHGPDYNFWSFPAFFAPSTLFFAGGVAWFARERHRLEPRLRVAWEMPLAWFLLGFVALTIVRSKREVYLLPVLPGSALVAALWLERILDGHDESRFAVYVPRLLAGVLLVLGVALPVAAGIYLGQPWLLPLLGAALAVAAAVSAPALLVSERTGAGLAVLLLGGVLFFACTVRSVVPWVDREKKSLRPALVEAVALVPSGRAVYALVPDETTRGAVSFYTGRSVFGLPSRVDGLNRLDNARSELLAHLHGEKEMWVLAIEKREDHVVFKSVEGLKPDVVRRWPGPRDVRLLRFKAP